jgi:mRNA interferase RelE/StbE
MKTIIFTVAADKQLEALPQAVQNQVLDALIVYATTGRGDVKKMAGRLGFRLRVGRYRVVFDEDQQTVLAIYIGKRDTSTYSRH